MQGVQVESVFYRNIKETTKLPDAVNFHLVVPFSGTISPSLAFFCIVVHWVVTHWECTFYLTILSNTILWTNPNSKFFVIKQIFR